MSHVSTLGTQVVPLTLQGWGVQLVPLAHAHIAGLQAAASDGEVYKLRVTWVPSPAQASDYVAQALPMQAQGSRGPFAVVDAHSGRVLGTSSYHDHAARWCSGLKLATHGMQPACNAAMSIRPANCF